MFLLLSKYSYSFAVDESSTKKSVGKSSSNGNKKKADGQQNQQSSTKEVADRRLHSKKAKLKTLVEQSSFIDTPDHTCHRILLTSFQTEKKLAQFLNWKETIGFARQ